MKLEIKHIAPYLPFDVEVITSFNGIRYNKPRVLNGSDFNIIKKGGAFHKLVLRPLSDMQNYKVQLKALGYRTDNDAISDIISDISQCVAEYKIMLFLFENHFDWQDLIGQGLAVDINTLA